MMPVTGKDHNGIFTENSLQKFLFTALRINYFSIKFFLLQKFFLHELIFLIANSYIFNAGRILLSFDQHTVFSCMFLSHG